MARPRSWSIDEMKRFIVFKGPGWFVESLMAQTLIVHVTRTNKTPFIQSRASWPLTVTTLAITALGVWLPYSSLASSLGLTGLLGMYWPNLMLTLFFRYGSHSSDQGLVAAQEMDLNVMPRGDFANGHRS